MATAHEGPYHSLFKTGSMTDCRIVCGTTVDTPAHKLILIAESGFFRAAFTGNFKEAEESLVTLEDDPELVGGMLQWIYDGVDGKTDFRGECQYSFREICFQVIVADRYYIPRLLRNAGLWLRFFLREADPIRPREQKSLEEDKAVNLDTIFDSIPRLYGSLGPSAAAHSVRQDIRYLLKTLYHCQLLNDSYKGAISTCVQLTQEFAFTLMETFGSTSDEPRGERWRHYSASYCTACSYVAPLVPVWNRTVCRICGSVMKIDKGSRSYYTYGLRESEDTILGPSYERPAK